jgi:uncharacterized protein
MNPFLINNYIEPRFFCDRGKETKTLLSNISNGGNTAFFAQRRLGKTALIQHTFHLLGKKKTECIYLDIYATQNLGEFTNQLAGSIYKVFPENKGIGKKFLEAIRLLRPVITFDENTGGPELTLDITKPRQFEKTIPQLFQFLDAQNRKVVVAIDEFQQILEYPENNVEALLRTVIQQLRHVNFIFCGSNQRMMHQIFHSSKRPFYASTMNINLGKIPHSYYTTFIQRHFEQNRIKISPSCIELLLEITMGHTYYTQRLCHDVFATAKNNVTEDLVHQTFNRLLKDNEGVYFQYRNLLTSGQWQVLRAIASEEKVTQPYSSKFINTHELGTPATVKRALEALIEKEMIFHQGAIENPYFELNDKFLMRWLQRL